MSPRVRGAGADTREHILDAAVSVVHQLGLARATTKEIARGAGLSEAALYRHFADKSELVLAMVGERVPRLPAVFEELSARVGRRTVRANLDEIVRVALPYYDEAVPIVAALFGEPDLLARYQQHMRANTDQQPMRANTAQPMRSNTEQQPMRGHTDQQMRANSVGSRAAGEHLATYVRAEQRLGRIGRRVDPEAAAWLVLGPCIGRTLVRRFVGDPPDAETNEHFIKNLVQTVMLALAPDKRS